MIEVLVAVVIMGLVATAALKLAGLSSRALGEVRERAVFLERARAIQTEVLLFKKGESSGNSLDIEWRVENKDAPILDEATFGKLEFGEKSGDLSKTKWRELLIKGKNQEITLILPIESENE